MDKLTSILHTVVAFLEKKVPLILAISALVLSYLVTEKTISPQLGTLLQAIISLLGGGTSAVASTQSYKTSPQGIGANK